MHHIYEISLQPPGKELIDVNGENHPSYESEGMMRRTEQEIPGSILNDDTTPSNEETGTLSLITEQRIIRRAYLNNRMIPTEIDTCSLVSIVMSDDPKLNRTLRIKRKLNTYPLIQDYQRMKGSHEYKRRSGVREGPEPHAIEDGA